MNSMLQAFTMVLDTYSMEEITQAFKAWMRSSATMPTPHDILEQAKIIRKEAREAAQSMRAKPAEKQERTDIVAWSGMSWKEIESKGFMPQVEQHLIDLTKEKGKGAAADYLHYLKNGPQNN